MYLLYCRQGDDIIDKQTQEIINRFQDSLSTLRKVAGWSAEHLAEILDVTRQTIVNLETGQTKMTKIQYLAFRTIFNNEIEASNNEMLAKLILILVDSNDLDDKHRTKVKETVNCATNSIGRRAGASTASKAAKEALIPLLAGATFSALFPPLGIINGIIIGHMSASESLKKKNKDTK